MVNIPRLLFLLVWVVMSASIYGACCAVTGMFSRKLSQIIGSAWNRHLLWLAGVKVIVSGGERLEPRACYVFFSNHQSALDIPILYTALSHPLVFIAKKELFWIPIMGWGMHGMGHIVLDRSSARKARNALAIAVKRLQKNNLSLVLFPEGTRSADGKLGDFKQGSFTLSIEAGVPLVPVTIEKANERLPKKELLIRSGTVYVTIGNPINPSGKEKGELSAMVRAEIEHVIASGIHKGR
jgi:1-acyl-sn-glycerol-3-phosphate acyltransferase